MASRILLYVAGLLAATCLACVPVSATAPPPPAGGTQTAGGPRLAGCAMNHVGVLPASWANLKTLPGGPPPDPSTLPSPTDPIAGDLTAAFNIAPQFFKDRLCALTGIYIVPGGDSWGYRDVTSDPNSPRTYLALSADLWGGLANPVSAPHFTTYEDGVVQRLARWNDSNFKHTAKSSNDPSNAPAMTVLAMLAHEYGHVLFYQTHVAPFMNPPVWGGFCSRTFYSQSWQSFPAGAIPWRGYEDIDGTHKQDGIQIADIENASPSPSGKGDLLHWFYSRAAAHGQANGHGRWASLFAGFTPDHDFVETFKLFVLFNSGAPLTTLEIDIPGSAQTHHHDIPMTCSKRPILMTKLTCMQQAFCPTCKVVCP